MPPVNISFATATTIGAFPYDFTQTDINDAGVNSTVYYRFIAPAGARVMGAWAFSGNIAVGYRPLLTPYNGPVGAPTQVLTIAFRNVPLQFPVVPGQEYFLEIQKNIDTAGPEQVRVQVEVAPTDTISGGNILVNDDSQGYPLAVLSHTVDNRVINFVKDIAAGEAGDIFNSVICLEKFSDTTIRIYNSSFTEIGNLSTGAGSPRIRTCKGLGKFFLAKSRNPVPIRDILITGAFGAINQNTTWTNVQGFAVSNDGLIAYSSSTASGSAIRRWDMTLNIAMADLAAGVANYTIVDILVLSDGSIIALYERFGTGDVFIRRYNAAGTLQNTYTTGFTNDEPAGTFSRLAYANDDPSSFWCWIHPDTEPGVSKFVNITVSSGTIAIVRTFSEYEGGGYEAGETAAPTARFGNSFSCPFMIMSSTGIYGGVYILVPDKTEDTVNNGGVELNLAIPDPTFRTGLLG